MKHLKILASVAYNEEAFRNEFSFPSSYSSKSFTHEFTIDYRISALDPSIKFFYISRIKDLRTSRVLTHYPITVSTCVPYDADAVDHALHTLGVTPYLYCIHQVLKHAHILLFNLKK